jgi:hypothetical protein
MRFERIQDESTLSDSAYAGGAIETRMAMAATHEVESRHLIPIDYRSLNNDTLLALCNQLDSIAPQLSSGRISDQAHYVLKQLAPLMEHPAILVQYLKVKVASTELRSPFEISPNSSSHFQASLISCDVGEVLWQAQVLLRDLPRVEESNFKESIDLLYKTFPNKKE